MSRTYFGTDGIRGKVGEFPLTAEFALKLGYAAGKALANGQKKPSILIGKDTRISGDMFESALAAGLTYAGVNVILAGILPTPAIAYLTKKHQCIAGVVVSASHNPYYDNGIKFFNNNGEKLDDAIELLIESFIDEEQIIRDEVCLGTIIHHPSMATEYIDFCLESAKNLSLKNKKIVLDCAHGATFSIAPKLFEKLGATVITIGASPNGININDAVGSTAPKSLQEKVLAESADCGIAFDGDGDRLLIVDEKGRPFDGDDILYLLAIANQEKRIVGTVMSNLGFENALKEKGIDLLRSKVGDRYVLELLNQENLSIGGENSGHILCLNIHSTGDGIIAAIQSLKAIETLNSSFAELRDSIPKTTQVMHNVRINKGQEWNTPLLNEQIRKIESQLGSEGRVLIRASGTEPVVRVMVEYTEPTLCENYTETLANTIRQEIAPKF